MAADNNNNGGGRLFLRSLCIDGYKCFSGFELPFGEMTLLLGKNGCGKTAVFEVINALSRFACHKVPVGDLFPAASLTRWNDGNKEQAFELRASEDDGESDFRYRLTVEHLPERARIKSETLTMNGEPLFEFSDGGGDLYPHPDNGQSGGAPMTIPFRKDVSGIEWVGEYGKGRRLQNFLKWLDNITLLSLVPGVIRGDADGESQYPNTDGGNFASWYRWAVRKNAAEIKAADEALRRILPGYRRLKLINDGNGKPCELHVVFASRSRAGHSYTLDELSGGERALIASYCFLHGGGRNRLLLLDEPDNFVTLPEVQPLIRNIAYDAGDELPQVAMISHHPEAMDFISPEYAVWMEREAEQPARIVKGFKNDTPLPTSELFSQGMAP